MSDMPRFSREAFCLAVLVMAGIGVVSHASGAEARRDPVEIMRDAFRNRYEVDTTSKIRLTMRDTTGREHRREFEAATKMIDGRLHSIGRLTAPEYLRGMAIMTIEVLGRSHDAFVYLPSLGRSRRISTAQRGDSFFGTDVTYEDLERRKVEEYEFDSVDGLVFQGEKALLVSARSATRFSYAAVEFVVSERDGVILETRYFKESAEKPYRVVKAFRDSMLSSKGHILPTHMLVENRVRQTTTEVRFHDLVVSPEIDDRVFSVRTLDAEGRLPGR